MSAPKPIKVFRPKSKRKREVLDLWEAWVGTRVHEVPDAGFFIPSADMDLWDKTLTDFIVRQAKIPKGADW